MKAAVFLILSLFSMTANATLDLTLPKLEYDPDFCKKYSCDFSNNILPKLEFNPRSEPSEKFIFYALNVIDVWSTDRAISREYGKEVNPLLPDRPSLERLVLHKTVLIGAYEYANWLNDKQFVVTMNWTLGAVVLSNVRIIIDNEY